MVIVTATLPQYANGNFFLQSAGSNINQVAGILNNFGVFAAPILPNVQYGITILPPTGTSYSRFGVAFTSINATTQDITAILTASIPPPFGIGGTVTNDEGALTAGSLIMGNDGVDITTVPGADYGVSTPDVLTLPTIVINLSTDGNAGVVLNNTVNDSGIAFIMGSDSSTWGAEVTGSASPIQGYIFEDIDNGAVNLLLLTLPDGTPVASLLANGIFGFVNNLAIDTGLSRLSQAIMAIGNGTQGDASGGLAVAVLVGPATAPSGSGTSGQWALSQDGVISFCKAGTWEVVATAT